MGSEHSDEPAMEEKVKIKGSTEPAWELIELLFFAYRDFVGDPDEVLARFGFGRAHHRVLHFVFRNPGLKVAELLRVLRITKQSLGRVLKQLVDDGYIEQREGKDDRRQRLLFATAKGEALVLRLAGLQTERINNALAAAPAQCRDAVAAFLRGMIDHDARDRIVAMILKGGVDAERRRLQDR